MRKNGSKIISFSRYKATDLLIFAAILAAFGAISFFAFTEWFATDSSRYIFSISVPITLLIMVRWNWYGMFYAVGDGLLYCILMLATGNMAAGSELSYFLIYGAGSAFIGFTYLMVKFMGYKRIVGAWYFTVLYAVCGWVLLVLGRTLVWTCFGLGFVNGLLGLGGSELLSLGMALIILLVLRRLDGMMENQRDYLIRLDRERKEKMLADNFGEEPIEIDEEMLKTLNKKGEDLFSK